MIRHNIHLYICYANKIILTVVSDPSVLYINHTNACMFMQKKPTKTCDNKPIKFSCKTASYMF